MRKQVMKVEIFGRTIVVRYVPGNECEYCVYEILPNKKTIHLDSFECFSEAWAFIEEELW